MRGKSPTRLSSEQKASEHHASLVEILLVNEEGENWGVKTHTGLLPLVGVLEGLRFLDSVRREWELPVLSSLLERVKGPRQ